MKNLYKKRISDRTFTNELFLKMPTIISKNISRNLAPKMKAPDVPLILLYAGINNSKHKPCKCEIT